MVMLHENFRNTCFHKVYTRVLKCNVVFLAPFIHTLLFSMFSLSVYRGKLHDRRIDR